MNQPQESLTTEDTDKRTHIQMMVFYQTWQSADAKAP